MPPEDSLPSPSQRIPRALVIGTGSIGERHLRCAKSSGQWTVAACEANPAQRQAIAERYDCPAYASIDEACSAEELDAAFVCTPAHLHIPMALECIDRGMHVLIEKPLALGLDGIADLGRLAAAKSRVVRVAYTARSVLGYRALKRIADSGTLGDIRHIAAVAGQHFPSFRPTYRDLYYAKRETGGGAIQDHLTHMLHAIEWIVSPFQKLFCHGRRQVLEGTEVEDTANVSAVLRSGALASLTINQFQPPNEIVLQLNGTLGSALLEAHNHRVGTFLHGGSDWSWTPYDIEYRDGPFVRQAAAFARAIADGADGLANLAEGTQTLLVNLAALKSMATGKEVEIP